MCPSMVGLFRLYLLAALEEEDDESPFSWMASPFCWTSERDWKPGYMSMLCFVAFFFSPLITDNNLLLHYNITPLAPNIDTWWTHWCHLQHCHWWVVAVPPGQWQWAHLERQSAPPWSPPLPYDPQSASALPSHFPLRRIFRGWILEI